MAGFGLADQMGQAAPGMPDMGGPEMTPDLMPGGDMALQEAAFDILGAVTSTPPEQRGEVLEVMVQKHGPEIVEIVIEGAKRGEFDDILGQLQEELQMEGIGPGGGAYGTGAETMYPAPGMETAAEYGYPEGRF